MDVPELLLSPPPLDSFECEAIVDHVELMN